MSTHLITGAAGFIGSHLCDRLLAEGRRVVAVDDLSVGRIANLSEARRYEPQFAFYNLDIRAEGLRTVFERLRPEVVHHLAAQTSVRRSVDDPAHDADVNILGLLNVLEAASNTGVRKIVFSSSGGTIYGEPRRLPVAETARRGSLPDSPYGISKKAAEGYLTYYRRARGLDFTALALANVYGPRQDPFGEGGAIAIFGAAMLNGGRPVIFGDGEQTRDYVFVDDVVHAFALATDKAAGALLNVGTGVETTVNELARQLSTLTGFVGEPSFGPARPGEVLRSSLDAGLAGRRLGWKPWTTLPDGLKATVDWLRAEGSTGR